MATIFPVATDKRDEWVKMRASKAEKERMTRQAESEGLSLSSWLRTKAFAALPPKKATPKKR